MLTDTNTFPRAGRERGSSDLPVFRNATEISLDGSAQVTMLIRPRCPNAFRAFMPNKEKTFSPSINPVENRIGIMSVWSMVKGPAGRVASFTVLASNI